MRPFSKKGTASLRIGLHNGKGADTYLRLSQIESMESENLSSWTDIELESNRWSTLCVCPSRKKNCGTNGCQLYIRATSGQHLGWHRGFAFDQRFISFGIANWYSFSETQLMDPEFDASFHCSQSIKI